MEIRPIETKTKEVKKMVKVRINIPTLKYDFTEDKMPEQKMLSQMVVTNNVLVEGTVIEVPEAVATQWCNEVFYIPDGRFGVRNHQDLGVESPYSILQDPEVRYSQKIQALNEYGLKMDRATKKTIHRATLIA